ncbi:hypothetical protein OV079_26960 [Nannocystis pusilla]|uniref:Uncharacterized protein n=1 Tax=Nannocystis pusilla TaxID=889268 RepID=A0A9X3ERS0_9BACT|nr:hypothetical protein [Nannocystis pusilla]MCY1009139.1 hypothetical protein [Nannocystis pusilla]
MSFETDPRPRREGLPTTPLIGDMSPKTCSAATGVAHDVLA